MQTNLLPKTTFVLLSNLIGLLIATTTIGQNAIQQDSFSLTPPLDSSSSIQRFESYSGDTLMFEPDQILGSTYQNAYQLLFQIPGIQLDETGQLNFRGLADFRIYVDNQPLSLNNQLLTIFLQQIPAFQIEKVEVYTNPGHSFLSDGSAGIIQFHTKKDQPDNETGLYFNYGSQNQFAPGLKINKQFDRFAIQALYHYRQTNELGYGDYHNFSNESVHHYDSKTTHKSHLLDGQLSYNLTDRQSLQLTAQYLNTNWRNFIKTSSISHSQLEDLQTNQLDLEFKRTNLGLQYLNQFKQPNHQLSINVQVLHSTIDYGNLHQSAFFIADGQTLSSPLEIDRSNIPGDYKQAILSTTYQFPLSAHSTIQTGINGELLEQKYQGAFFEYNPDSELFDRLESKSISNESESFRVAGFLNYFLETKKWKLEIGNKWMNRQYQPTSDNPTKIATEWLPRLSLQYAISPISSLVFNANRRFTLPNYPPIYNLPLQLLAHQTITGSPGTLSTENKQLELIFQQQKRSFDFRLGGFYQILEGQFLPQVFFSEDSDALTYHYQPFGEMTQFGLEGMLQYRFSKKTRLYLQSLIYRPEYEVYTKALNHNVNQWQFAFTSRFWSSLWKNGNLMFSLQWNDKREWPQRSMESLLVGQLVFEHSCVQDRLKLTFGLEDLFNNRIYSGGLFNGNGQIMDFDFRTNSRLVHFGARFEY